MGTAKRERQKSNRQARLEQLAREARIRKSKRVGMRLTIVVLLVVGVVAAVYFASGDDSLESSVGTAVTIDTSLATDTTVIPTGCPTTTTVPGSVEPSSTLAPTTTIAYAKPAVQIPAELPTELKVTTLKDGAGPAAKTCDDVLVHYVGVRSADGVEFDNSYDRGSAFPVTLGVTGLIQGWTDGLVGVQAGGQYQLDIPANLAYGDTGSGDVIRPGDAITFVVDIVSVTPAA